MTSSTNLPLEEGRLGTLALASLLSLCSLFMGAKKMLDIKSHFRFRNQNNFNKSRFLTKKYEKEDGKMLKFLEASKRISFLLSLRLFLGLTKFLMRPLRSLVQYLIKNSKLFLGRVVHFTRPTKIYPRLKTSCFWAVLMFHLAVWFRQLN